MTKNPNPAKKKRAPSPNDRPTIGFLTSDRDPFFHLMWCGIANVARERNINAICFAGNYVYDYKAFKAQANILYDMVDVEQLDGLVIWGLMCNLLDPNATTEFYERYRPLPIVSVAQPMAGITNVLVDNYGGMREAINHLIEVHGRRRIAYIKGLPNFQEHDDRYQAYVDVLAEYGLPFDPRRVAAPHDAAERAQLDWGRVALCRLLDDQKAEFDALVTNDDRFAHNLLPELQARGIRVPGDIALVSFDDMEGSNCLPPPLTSVRFPMYELGRRAAETLVAQLEGQAGAEQLEVPARLIVRQSCGCLDSQVTQVVAGPVTRTGAPEPLESSLAGQREKIVAAMIRAAENSVAGLNPGWAEQLLDGFVAALTTAVAGEAPARFLSMLDEILRQVLAAEGDIEVWQHVLSTLRRQLLPYFGADETGTLYRDRAGDLWLQAQVMIGRVGQRAQAYRDLQAEQRKRVLSEIGTALTTNFDLNDMADILARELPGLGIARGYLSLYEHPQPYRYPQPAPQWSRLVLAYDEENPAGSSRVELAADGRRYPSRQLVPEGILPQQGQYTLVVRALYFQNEQIGFILLDGGQRDGDVYSMLRAQISSALKGALLVKQEKKRIRQLQTVAEVGTAASTILDIDKLLQTMVDLTRTRFDLYHAHIYLLNETEDILVLKAGAGAKGRQMVEQGWSLPVTTEQSLVVRAAQNRQGEIVNNVQANPHWLPNPLLPNTRSELAVPLIVSDQLLGVLDVQANEIDYFTEEDVHIQSTLAAQIAVAIKNAQLYRKEAERVRELGQLNKDLETAQAELLRRERLSALGQLTATVAHEIRNPLGTVRNSVYSISAAIERGQFNRVEPALQRAERNITRCDNIITELLDYTRTHELKLQPVCLDEWLQRILDELTIPEGIILSVDLAKKVEVFLGPERFRRVIVNLVDNACQAMQEASQPDRPEQILRIQSEIVDSQLKISITDTGPGIPPEVMPHIFEPLYSTKNFGVGLGLPVVESVIKQHGGKIEINSEVDTGTQVIVWLPLGG
ncbi:substrate-binding domain-containing protein [Chloroflexota bacterium]